MSEKENTLIVSFEELDIENSSDPLVRQVFNYWIDLTESRELPDWSDWNWDIMPPDTIPHCGVVDVIHEQGVDDLRYRFWGTAHVRAHGIEMTGRSVLDMEPAEEARSVFKQYMSCRDRRRPCLFINTIRNPGLDMNLQENSLRLPFSNNGGGDVAHILAYSHIVNGARMAKDVFTGSNF